MALALFLQRVTKLQGWRRNSIAFLAGIAMTLALPPAFLLPMLIPAFTILYWLIDAAPHARRAFADGWWWGMGWHITGLYWFCIALLTDPEKFAWLIPFTLIGLNAIIALYAAVACWLWKKTGCRGLTGIFVFTVIWLIIEYARGHLFSGFPWNLAGYSFVAFDASLQLASLVGAYGLTWFAVLLGVMPAVLADEQVPAKKARAAALAVWLLFAVGTGWGAWHLSQAETRNTGTKLRLVQPNIEQNHKWDPALRRQVISQQVELSQLPGVEAVDYVIWPETAVPYALASQDVLSRLLGRSLPPNAQLITGSVRMEQDGAGWRMFNSIVALNHAGDVTTYYDKSRLVPFGEFLPFRSLLPQWMTTPVGDTDFSAGRPGETLALPDERHAMLPLICYEVVFPEMGKADPSFAAPSWILNLTNDAWFGQSSGPYQHFHMARMRAVERGLPLVRVANTGISAVVDSNGRILSKMNLGKKGILDVALPAPASAMTLYDRLGERWIMGLIFIGLVLIRGQRKTKNN